MASPETLPDTMRGLELSAYHGPSALHLVDKPLPRPGPGQLLVEMHAAPINPSDLLFLSGRYGQKKTLPVVPGFEGSGTVVAVGSGLLPRLYLGRQVACGAATGGDGTWAEYLLTSPLSCIPLRGKVSLDQGATMLVNPTTAYLLMQRARRVDAVISTAALSQVGRMLHRLSRHYDVPIIHTVRRDEQVATLRDLGATHVLNSSDDDFEQQLYDLSHDLNATLAFDAVAGPMSARLLGAMPQGSRVVVYGALSEDDTVVSPKPFIFEDKRLEGFWLGTALRGTQAWRALPALWRIPKLMGDVLQTEVRAKVPLEEFEEGLEHYQQSMSRGKILLTP